MIHVLIIGNVNGVRNPSDPDPNWCRKEDTVNHCLILQAVQTKSQKLTEQKGMKKLIVTNLVEIDVSVDKIKELQTTVR